VSDQLKIPELLVKEIFYNLVEVNLLSQNYYEPALEINEITVAKALEHLERYGHDEGPIAEASPVLDALEDSFQEIKKLIRESDANRLLVEL